MNRFAAAVLAVAIASAACAKHERKPSPGAAAVKSYDQEIQEWHSARMERLKKPGGWLSLAGLFWLRDGSNSVGADAASDIVLPKGAPSKVGTITLATKSSSLSLEPGVKVQVDGKPAAAQTIALRSDVDPALEPVKISVGSITFWIIDRAGKQGVRVTNDQAPERATFTGIATFPVDPKWRVEARFEPAKEKKTVAVPTVIDGVFEEMEVAGTAIFTVDGKEYRLDPVLEKGETEYFFIFRDATAGHETYGAGRFLYASPAKDGRVVIDFNKAYNPPCALTPFATCPLPPPQNVLSLRVEAGEKNYGHHGSPPAPAR